MLEVIGSLAMHPLAQEWADALRGLSVEHPDPRCSVVLLLTCDVVPRLLFRIPIGFDTTDRSKEIRPLDVAEVSLMFFPGAAQARSWVTAAWSAYLIHEALELVTYDGRRPIDPHGERIASTTMDVGMPSQLTPIALRASLAIVMTPQAIGDLLGAP